MSTELTLVAARELLHYEPKTGVLTWRVSAGRAIRAGDVAGYLNSDGYRRVTIYGRTYRAHRLAWFIHHGEWPNKIDHKYGDRDGNDIDSMRSVTVQTNNENRRSAQRNNLSTGLLGVTFCKRRRKFKAQIGIDGRIVNLGYFDDPMAGHRAYLSAKRVAHPGCTI